MASILLLIALIAQSVAQSTYFTTTANPTDPCDDNGDFRITYVTAAPQTADNCRLDNICHTFYDTNDALNNSQVFFSRVYSNGEVQITSYVARYNNTANEFTFASPSCTFTDFRIGYVGQTNIFHRRINSGVCTVSDGTPTIEYPVLAASSGSQRLSASELTQINQVVRGSGLRLNLISLPMRLPFKCVIIRPCSNSGSFADSPAQCYGSGYPNSYDTSTVTYYPNYNYNNPSSNGCGCPQ